jgi:NADPH-dependent curcumin reductase CurA
MMSEAPSGQRVVLCRYPKGSLRASDFAVEACPAPSVQDGEFLVRTMFISVDPMLRLFVDQAPFGGAMPPMPLGTTIPGAAVGKVVESRHPGFAVGELVEGRFGWRDYAASNGVGANRVNPALGAPENALGIAGLPGFTAYVGLHAAGGIKPGQTILVSGAAGAVGSAAGALIRARGGRAVGIAGGEAKRRYLIEEVGYEAVADRFARDFLSQLAAALPKGADIYFDNVGGPLLAQLLPSMARGGLVLICGLMAQYQDKVQGDDKNLLPEVLRAVMFKGLRIQGFSQVGQDALRPAFEKELAVLLASGQIKPKVHTEEGIERLPAALVNLFDKSTTGKVVVRVAQNVPWLESH